MTGATMKRDERLVKPILLRLSPIEDKLFEECRLTLERERGGVVTRNLGVRRLITEALRARGFDCPYPDEV